jgi:hypothetical protein
MIKISILLAICVTLAWLSEKKTDAIRSEGYRYSVWNDNAYLLLVVVLVLFSGLRTAYNDTWNYISGFRSAPSIADLMTSPDAFNIFKNPLYYFTQSLIKDLTNDSQVLIFVTSAFTQICFLRFFKRYSENFTLSVFIYFALGTFNVSLGALKQVLAMSILTLAFPHLESKQYVRYYILVFLAMLFHTYAIFYAVLPLFSQKPWKPFTYIFVCLVAVLMTNFEEVIREFMEQANELGKTLEDYEVFHDHTVNLFRVAVYVVPPLISFIFQRRIFHNSNTMQHILVHMSIISLAFMVMGTQSGANMFARMAHYFEMGTVCCLPWMLKKPFDKASYRLVIIVTVLCFLGFFVYANGLSGSFDDEYRAIYFFRDFFS